MKCNVLAICDEQILYAESLAKQILRMDEGVFQVCRFATEEQLLIFARGQKISCLLVSEEYEEVLEKVGASQYFCLTSQRHKADAQEGKTRYIYRYQSIEQIHSQLIEGYDADELGPEDVHVSIIGVYNPVHRNGQTTLAQAIGQEYGAGGKRVLYLNLEEYSGCNRAKGGEGFEEILYYLKKDVTNINYKLAGFTKKQGNYDTIEPVKISEELRKIRGQEWIEFLKEIYQGSGYNVIILDLDSCIQGFLDILEMCEVIYMPIRDRMDCLEKREQFYNNMRMLQREKLLGIIQEIKIEELSDIEESERISRFRGMIREREEV